MTLPSSVVGDLRLHVARYGASPYLFTARNGTPVRSETWRSCIWRPAVAATGLAPLRPHLKHTGLALLAAAGVDPLEIAHRAGRSSVSFTYDRYGHLFPEIDGRKAVKLDALRIEGLERFEAADSCLSSCAARRLDGPRPQHERPGSPVSCAPSSTSRDNGLVQRINLEIGIR